MEHLWIAFILGIVEGLTEFLPVSSTGHLILVGHLFGFYGDQAETFEIVIQLGAILAIVVLYWRRFLVMSDWRDKRQLNESGRYVPRKRHLTWMHVLMAIFPAMFLGFILHGWIKQYLFSPATVLIGLVVGGIFMIYAEKKQTWVEAHDLDELTYKQAWKIGLFQCLSLWPGFSRAGATIGGALLSGVSMRASADFSFLIAVPVLFAAGVYDLWKNIHLFTMDDFLFFAIGFIVSFIVAWLAVVGFLQLLQKLKLATFAYYRFFVAGLFYLYMIS